MKNFAKGLLFAIFTIITFNLLIGGTVNDDPWLYIPGAILLGVWSAILGGKLFREH